MATLSFSIFTVSKHFMTSSLRSHVKLLIAHIHIYIHQTLTIYSYIYTNAFLYVLIVFLQLDSKQSNVEYLFQTNKKILLYKCMYVCIYVYVYKCISM